MFIVSVFLLCFHVSVFFCLGRFFFNLFFCKRFSVFVLGFQFVVFFFLSPFFLFFFSLFLFFVCV